jgi:hypothetical protein
VPTYSEESYSQALTDTLLSAILYQDERGNEKHERSL